MALDSTSDGAGRDADARARLAALDGRSDLNAPLPDAARRIEEAAVLLGKALLACEPARAGGTGGVDVGTDELGAALGLFEGVRFQLDQLETQVIIESRRRGMDWRQIADEQGLNTPQAASQRYQRLMTRLEEVRLGVR